MFATTSRRAAGAAVVALLAVPTTAAAGARAVYVASGVPGGPGTIAQFSVRVADGLPTPLSPPTVATGGDPQHVAVTSDGRFAYATAADPGEVWEYAVGASGALTPIGTAPAAPGAHGVAVAPNDHSVYVANQGNATVSQFDVQPDGTLAPKSPPAVPAEAGASGVAVAPDGDSAYVTNLDAGTVSQYDVDRATGALAPKSPAAVGAPPLASGLGTSPNAYDMNVYVASLSGRLAQYSVDDKTGELAPLAPPSLSVGAGSAGVAARPDGDFVYTPDAGTGSVSQFSRASIADPAAPGGLLTPLNPAAVPAGSQPEGIAVTPDGDAVYAADRAGGTLVWLASDPRKGLLSPGDPPTFPTGAGPHGIVVTPDQGPALHLRAPRVVRVGKRVRFDARPASDPDGSITYFLWDLGDGPPFDVRPFPHFIRSRRPVLSYRYRKPGRYVVSVAAIDNEGCSFWRTYTGQTASCAGSRQAGAGQRISVRP
jgi:DNA-binding beta-propeller fold protein YncE